MASLNHVLLYCFFSVVVLSVGRREGLAVGRCDLERRWLPSVGITYTTGRVYVHCPVVGRALNAPTVIGLWTRTSGARLLFRDRPDRFDRQRLTPCRAVLRRSATPRIRRAMTAAEQVGSVLATTSGWPVRRRRRSSFSSDDNSSHD